MSPWGKGSSHRKVDSATRGSILQSLLKLYKMITYRKAQSCSIIYNNNKTSVSFEMVSGFSAAWRPIWGMVVGRRSHTWGHTRCRSLIHPDIDAPDSVAFILISHFCLHLLELKSRKFPCFICVPLTAILKAHFDKWHRVWLLGEKH